MEWNRTDFVVMFPFEINCEVFKHLSLKELGSAERTCGVWRDVISSGVFWKNLYKKKYRIRNAQPKSWKEEYKHQFLRTHHNRLIGHYTSKQLSLSSPDPISAFQIDGNKIIYAQGNQLYKSTFPATRLTAIKTWILPQPNDQVTCMQYDDNILVSGTQLGAVVIWSLNSASMDPDTILASNNGGQQSDNPVQALQFDDEYLCIARSNTLQVWKRDHHPKMLHTLTTDSAILCLQFDGSKVVSGTATGTLLSGNIRTGSLLCTHNLDPLNSINSLHFEDDERVYVGRLQGDISSVDVRSGRIGESYREEGRPSSVVKIHVDDEYVVAGHEDGSVSLWSRESKQLLSVLQGHGGRVTCIESGQCMVVASSVDVGCGLLVWDYSRQDDMFGADLLELDFTEV